MGEPGRDCQPPFLTPSPCLSPGDPWRDFIIGFWLAPFFQLINTVMRGAPGLLWTILFTEYKHRLLH